MKKRELKQRIAELEAENARLREQVRRLTAPRRGAYRAQDGTPPLGEPPRIATAVQRVTRSGSNGGE